MPDVPAVRRRKRQIPKSTGICLFLLYKGEIYSPFFSAQAKKRRMSTDTAAMTYQWFTPRT